MEDSRRRIQDGGFKMEDSRWRIQVEDSRWRIQDGGFKMEDSRWKIKDGR